jgi:hypothetical protein
MVFPEAEREDPVERPEGARPVTQFEEDLAAPREAVFMVGIERQRSLEALPGPGVVLSREVGISHPHVEFYGIGVELSAFAEEIEGVIEPPFVVQLVSTFVVVVGAEKPIRLQGLPPGGEVTLR